MLPQLDLTLEAKHLKRFNRDFANNDRVSFPRPIDELTTTRVLTETFLNGRPIMEYTTRDESTRKDLANLGLHTTLQMIFVNDFLHGDLHPGNILVEEDGDGKGRNLPPKLHLLDCGLVVEMGPDQHVNLVKILGAFTRRDGRLAGQLMVDTSSSCQASDVDVELFVNGALTCIIFFSCFCSRIAGGRRSNLHDVMFVSLTHLCSSISSSCCCCICCMLSSVPR